MKVQLSCDYMKGDKVIGRYGETITSSKDLTLDELKGLVAMGSAIEVETKTDKT